MTLSNNHNEAINELRLEIVKIDAALKNAEDAIIERDRIIDAVNFVIYHKVTRQPNLVGFHP